MVKSDVHMERVRTRLVDEASGIKKSEAAKKQRDLKKYGKQIQHEKLKQRVQDRKGMDERIRGIKRKRKDGVEVGDEGEGGAFDVRVEDAIEGGGGRDAARGGRAGGKPKVRNKWNQLRALLTLLADKLFLSSFRCLDMREIPNSGWVAVASDRNRTLERVPMTLDRAVDEASLVPREVLQEAVPRTDQARRGGTRGGIERSRVWVELSVVFLSIMCSTSYVP